jgi:hypothetical protein
MGTEEKGKGLPIFFIVGRARSGTTLLKVIFDAHTQINIPAEDQFILHLYSRYRKVKYWDKATLNRFFEDVMKLPFVRNLNMDNERLYKNLLSAEGYRSYGEICKLVYCSCKAFQKKEIITMIGNKNIRYSMYIPFLIKVFPDAKFIYITRDYRDNILSMLRVDFEAHIISALAYRWKYFNKKIRKAREEHPQNFYTLKYEEFVKDAERYTKEMCSFLNIHYQPGMMKFYENKNNYTVNDLEEATNKEHKSLFNPVTDEKVYSWRTEMTERQVRIADNVVGKYAEELGYERKYKKRNWINYAACLPGITYGKLYFVLIQFINILPFTIRKQISLLLIRIFKPRWSKHKIVDKN